MSNTTNKKKTYYAFFDAEYTCYMESDAFFDREHSGEILSVGIVVTDKSFNLLQTYYSPIHPIYNAQLTGYCKKLTGLTQEEIDNAPSYEEVFQEVYLLLQEYPVKEIFTWGNDAHTLLHDIEKNHKFVPRKFKKTALLLSDLTRKLTRKVFGKGMTVSLSDMKYICDMEHRTAHNALEDAKDLYLITKCCVQGTYNKTKVEKLQKYIQNRDMYHQYRRFKKTFLLEQALKERKADVSGDLFQREEDMLRQISMEYIDILKKYFGKNAKNVPMEILAMCDDVRSLAGMESTDKPELE